MRLLAFMAEHRIVLAAQAQRLLDASPNAAQARLRALRRAGYVRRERPFQGRASFHLITRQGLRAAGSRLRAPELDLGTWQHDIGLAWLWLAARAGAFGPVREVVGERRMRSLDALASRGEAAQPGEPAPGRLGVRLAGVGSHGRERLHYPDLLLMTPGGRRIGVELELTGKGRRRREQILSGYAADARVDAVLYLVRARSIGRAVGHSARRLGIGGIVHVQEAVLGAGSAKAPATAPRALSRSVSRAAREAGR